MHSLDCIVIGDILWDIVLERSSIEKVRVGGTTYTRNATIAPGGAGNVAYNSALRRKSSVYLKNWKR